MATTLSGWGSKPCRSASRSAPMMAAMAPRVRGVSRATRSVTLLGGPAGGGTKALAAANSRPAGEGAVQRTFLSLFYK